MVKKQITSFAKCLSQKKAKYKYLYLRIPFESNTKFTSISTNQIITYVNHLGCDCTIGLKLIIAKGVTSKYYGYLKVH